MNTYMRSAKSKFAGTLLLLSIVMAAPAHAAKELPKTTHDGLELVENTKLRAVYMTKGASLDQYKRVALLDCYVAFTKNWQRDYNSNTVGLDRRISDKEMETIKNRVAAEFKKVFTAELETKGGYEIVDRTGADVLVIRPAIINLDVTAPDQMTAGMSRTYTADSGQMTLYMELYDSVSNSIIARVIDPEGARGSGFTMRADRVSNTADADRIMRKWADILRGHLGAVTKK